MAQPFTSKTISNEDKEIDKLIAIAEKIANDVASLRAQLATIRARTLPAHEILRNSIQGYAALIHPPLVDNGKNTWTGATGECIRDLQHRTKEYLGLKDWKKMTKEDAAKAATWLFNSTGKRFTEFKKLSTTFKEI